MADIIFPDALPLDSLAIPLWCRAQCRVLYPELGVGGADEELIAHIRADFSVARRSEPLLYALRQTLSAGCLRDFLASRPDAALIDLGCGLDTVLRLADNGRCAMIYADRPEAMALRRELLPPGERERYVECDVRDLSPLSGVDASRGVCIVMSGLLCHLEQEDVRALLSGLARMFPGARCLFDGNGRALARFSRRAGLRSFLPGAPAVRRWEGVGGVRSLKTLPESFRVLPRLKRLKLALLLRMGVIHFYDCTLA